MAILEASHIVKIYGDIKEERTTQALNGVSLSINQEEFIAIMGASGSGKTTLLNILSGLDKPTSGEVTIAGEKISEISRNQLALFRWQHLGFVFQDFNLLDSLTVKENMMLPMILEKKSAADIDQKVQELAALFGIEDILDKYPYHISGGQQQRTAVSRALVNNPSIILADEPTGNLDSASSADIMECFETIVENSSAAILLVTHDIFAASYCQKVVFIKDGALHSSIVRDNSREGLDYALYGKGGALFYLEEYEESIPYLEAYLELEPTDVEVLDALVYAYEMTGDYEEAIKYNDIVIDIDDDENLIYNIDYKGILLTKSGQLDEAEELYEEILEQHPLEKGIAYYGLSFIHIQRGEIDEGLDKLEEAVEEDPGLVEYAASDPLFEEVFDNERFIELVGADEDSFNGL